MKTPLLEICVDDASGLKSAVAAGADRIELCSALGLGGLTPTPGLMTLAARAGLPIMAMIRPRSGDFCFAQPEIDQMLAEIDAVRAAGLGGVVLGVSRSDDTLDLRVLRRLCDHAAGLDLTLHRAFDLVPDMAEALEQAVDLGFSRILTSGGAASAQAGIAALARLAEQAAGRIGILAGGGVTAENAADFLAIPGIHELHASGSALAAPSSEKARQFGFDIAGRKETSASVISNLRQAMAQVSLKR